MNITREQVKALKQIYDYNEGVVEEIEISECNGIILATLFGKDTVHITDIYIFPDGKDSNSTKI